MTDELNDIKFVVDKLDDIVKESGFSLLKVIDIGIAHHAVQHTIDYADHITQKVQAEHKLQAYDIIKVMIEGLEEMNHD